MQAPEKLQNLNLAELNTFLKHIRLGKDHLQKSLPPDEFHALLKLGSLNDEEYQHIQTDGQEQIGNISLVLNTIITSALGSWLGISAFIGLGLKSLFLLGSVILLTMGISGWIGWASFRLTRKKADSGIISKKLKIIELKLLQEIAKRRNTDINKTTEKILKSLGLLTPKFKKNTALQQQIKTTLMDQNNFTNLYLILEAPLKKITHLQLLPKANQTLKNKIQQLIDELKTLLSTLGKQTKTLKAEPSPQTNATFATYNLSKSVAEANTYVKILTSPDLKVEPTPPSPYHWLKHNIIALCTGIMPTLLGTFASMFVFLTGIPDVFQAFNIDIKSYIHNEIFWQILGISIAILLTTYYCYSYLHSNYKNFLRSKEVEKTDQHITEANEAVLKATTQFNNLTQVTKVLEELVFINILVRAVKRQVPSHLGKTPIIV